MAVQAHALAAPFRTGGSEAGRPVSATAASQTSHCAICPHCRQTSSWARPLRFTTHTARAPRSTVAWSVVVNASENKPLPGGSSRTSITSTRGQPSRVERAARARRRTDRGLGLERRRRAHERAARPGAAGPLERELPGIPRRRPLLLERFVAFVDDDDRTQVRNRREHRHPATDDDARPGSSLVPALRATRVGLVSACHDHFPAAPSQIVDQQRGTRLESGATTIVDASSATSASTTSLPPAAGGHASRPRSAAVQRVDDGGVHAIRRRVRRKDCGVELRVCSRRHHVGRRRRSEQQRERAGIAPRRPPAQLEHLGGGPADTTLASGRSSDRVGFRLDVVGDDPTPHAPAVQRDAHDGPDPDDAGDVLR